MKRLISLPIRHSVFGIMVKHSIFSRLQHSRYAKYKGLLSLKDFKIIILVSKLNWIKKNIWKVSTSLYHDTGKPKTLVFLSWNFSCSVQMVSKVKSFSREFLFGLTLLWHLHPNITEKLSLHLRSQMSSMISVNK